MKHNVKDKVNILLLLHNVKTFFIKSTNYAMPQSEPQYLQCNEKSKDSLQTATLIFYTTTAMKKIELISG